MNEPVRKIYVREDLVKARLRLIGVTLETLRAAVLFGESERRSCTRLDPRILGGILGWGRTVRGLREELVPSSWTAEELHMFSLTVRPDRGVALMVATGDDRAGRDGASPHTRHKKGEVFFELLRIRDQLSFLPEDDALAAPKLPDEIWTLLIARKNGIIYSELSEPTREVNGRVAFEGERIILPMIDTNEPVGRRDREQDDDENEGDLDIAVERI